MQSAICINDTEDLRIRHLSINTDVYMQQYLNCTDKILLGYDLTEAIDCVCLAID